MESSGASRGSSLFLQDMINEKRSQTQRTSRSRDLSGSSRGHDTRDIQSSPLGPSRERSSAAARKTSTRSPQGQLAPKEMGLREMQEHINKINKQNFDLKLEIFHRRQKCETLEARVSKLEGLEVDNEDLRAQNDELVLKLEKCDADLGMREDAIEEAVGMICELEAQIGDHEQDLARYRSIVDAGVGPPPGHAQMEPSTRITLEAKSALEDEHSPSHPRQEAIKRVASTSSILKSPLRPPSFLHDDRKSNTALRSLYSSRNPSIASFNRASSVLSDGELEEELERQMLSSPRLSILSESGFSSIYGHKRDKSTSPSVEPASPSDETFIAPNSSNEERHAQRKARISHWVEESRRQEAPKTPVHKPSRQASNARFSSIGELLEKTPGARSQQTEILASSPSQKSGSNSVRQGSDKSSSDSRSPTKSLRKSAKAHEKLSQHGSSNSVFSNNHLPPTPETMSTATIGRNSSTPSIVTEKSLAEGSSVPVNNYTRPTSSDSRKVSHFGRRPSTRDRDHDALDEDLQSTQAEQGGPRMGGDPAAFMNGSVKATRFFGSEVPRRPALNTHVTDMMFNGDGYSPKHASRNASYPAVAQVTERTPSAASPTSRRSSAIARDKITTSPRKAQSSAENQTFTNPSPTSLAIGNHPNVDTKSKSAASSLRFRLPHRVASSNNVQSVTSRIFKRNRPATVDEDPETQEAPLPQPPSRPRLGRPSSMHGQRPHFTEFQSVTARPGTADGSNDPRPSGERQRWKVMRRHSAVLDEASRPILLRDPETGLRRATESRVTMRAREEGRMRRAASTLKGGLGLRR